MIKEPLFVIVVPTYTRSELLVRSLLSIRDQSYKNWECIVVDDGSTDNTENVVKEFICEEPRFKYIKQENCGVNAARNNAIDVFQDKGKDCFYIFIDDDDYLSDQCLLKAKDMISKNSTYNWFGFNCINIETNKKVSKIKKYGANNYIWDLMFGKNWRGDITSFVHSSLVNNFRFCQEIKNGEEWFFWSQLAIKNDVFIKDEPGSFKDYLPLGLTKLGFNRDKTIQVLNLKLKIIAPVVGEKRMIHQIITLAKNNYQLGQHAKARILLKQAFKLNPFYFRQYPHWIKQFFTK
jgi:glycosyltransferase involved in cell wall biosynthesis